MKIRYIHQTFLFVSLLLLSACGSEKKVTEMQEFVISVDRSGAEINLSCQYGCAWKELSFNTRENQPTAVNQFGMAQSSDTSAPDSDQEALARFLFTIERTDNGVLLRGQQGTAWKSLSFSLNGNGGQAINHKGMVR